MHEMLLLALCLLQLTAATFVPGEAVLPSRRPAFRAAALLHSTDLRVHLFEVRHVEVRKGVCAGRSARACGRRAIDVREAVVEDIDRILDARRRLVPMPIPVVGEVPHVRLLFDRGHSCLHRGSRWSRPCLWRGGSLRVSSAAAAARPVALFLFGRCRRRRRSNCDRVVPAPARGLALGPVSPGLFRRRLHHQDNAAGEAFPSWSTRVRTRTCRLTRPDVLRALRGLSRGGAQTF